MLIARSRKKQISNEMVQGEIAKIEPK